MIYDIFTYNGEKDILDIHLNVLKPHVDKFIIIEFDKTFSGKPKPSHFREIHDKYSKDYPLAFYRLCEGVYNKYREQALASPNTEYGKGAEHWIREWCQKESIKEMTLRCLEDIFIY